MKSTMQDAPLNVVRLVRHARAVHPTAEVVTATAGSTRTATMATVIDRATQLAHALRGLGVDSDQRVATFMWNNQEHLEAYLGIPAMGAVLHPLNIRLSAEQLSYIASHAEDFVVIVDSCLVDVLARALPGMPTVRHVIVSGPDATAADRVPPGRYTVHRYEELLVDEPTDFDWPEIPEDDAAGLCYTSGTTGDPKGVAYSHRSVYLHSMAIAMGDGMRFTTQDRVLPVVPMFHANAWGMPYGAVLVGAGLVLPDRFTAPESLIALIESARPSLAAGVPTVWSDLLAYLRTHGGDLTSLRAVIGGGALVTVSLQQEMKSVADVLMVQAWGMTEISPTAVVGWPPTEVTDDTMWHYRAKQGRLMNLVEARLVDGAGQVLPHDGTAVGEIEVRGPYVTAGYVKQPDALRDGWFPTGDIGTLDVLGYLAITDRAKDMIKSGGEWISSVGLEGAIMAHPAVREAAVVGVPDPRWQERPLAIVVLQDGASATVAELRAFLETSLPRWQVPELWTFVDSIPRTSVGKFDKKVMRATHHDGGYRIAR